MRNIHIFLILFTPLVSCLQSDNEETFQNVPRDARVYVPVYGDTATAFKLTIEQVKPIESPNKIFLYQDFLIVGEGDEGFHVIDNSNPVVPQRLFFISIPNTTDLAVKDGVIFANNYSDIVAFKINESNEVEVIERLKNIMGSQEIPPFRDVYFECVDASKGVVIDWVETNSRRVKCYRP